MATGPAPFKSAFGLSGVGVRYLMMLRAQTNAQSKVSYAWQNWWFGTDFAGSATNKTLTDSMRGNRAQYHIGM